MLGTLAQYSRDLREFRRTGMASDLSAWSNLFARTNGLINDVTSFILRQRHGRIRYGDTSGVLGVLSAADRRKIIKTLRRESYYVFPQRMPERILSAIEAAALKTPARVSPKFSDDEKLVYDPKDPKAAIYNWGQSLVNIPEMQALMADETFTAIATDYLKVDPILDSAMPWLSIAYGNGPSHEGAQLYHYDLSHLRWLKIYCYLRDVNSENGPHCLVKGTQNPLDFKGAQLRRRGQVRIPDEDIVATYGADRVVEVTGPRGTVFAVDTRAFHKGKQVFSGERILLELYYVNANFGVSTPPEPVKKPTAAYREAYKRWPRLLSHFPISS